MARIAFDATVLSERPTGAARVIRNLMATLPAVDPTLTVIPLEGTPRSGLAWELRGATAAARQAGADVLFTVRELVGRASPPTVLHVFEPPRYRVASGFGRNAAKDVLLTALFPGSLRRAAAVTAGSATTAAWIYDRYRITAEVLLPGLEPAYFEPGPVATRSRPYLLHIAGSDQRDATELLAPALERLGAAAPLLVVAGGAGADLPTDRAERTGWVTDEELRALYRGAVALVHLARYEAYGGLPALEAMALGTPVVALRAPGVTEALEGAALLVDQPDGDLLAEALLSVTTDEALRERLVAEGRARVEPLRWERTASQLAAILHRVAG